MFNSTPHCVYAFLPHTRRMAFSLCLYIYIQRQAILTILKDEREFIEDYPHQLEEDRPELLEIKRHRDRRSRALQTQERASV